jgi:hypothetical protein
MFPPSPEHAFHAARGCVCPDGLPARPRSQTRHCPGLSVRGGPMRVDGATNPELIQQWCPRPDLAADADRQPQRPAGVTNPAVAEMHARDGSPICIFKTDRVGPRAGAGPRTPWVGAATPWSRATPKSLDPRLAERRSPPCRWLPRTSGHRSTCLPCGRRACAMEHRRACHQPSSTPSTPTTPRPRILTTSSSGSAQSRTVQPTPTRAPPALVGYDAG